MHLNRKTYEVKKKRFRFENVWLKEEECKTVVRNGWETNADLEIMEKIRLCGVRLQEWGGGVSNEYKFKLQNCRIMLRKLRSRRDVQGVQSYNANQVGVFKATRPTRSLLETEV